MGSGPILTCTIMPPTWLWHVCPPVSIRNPSIKYTVIFYICHFTCLVPVQTTQWFVVPWCFPSRYFCLTYSLTNLSPVATFLTYSLGLVFFGQWLWCSPWPPSFPFLRSFLSISLETSAPVCWTMKFIFNTLFFLHRNEKTHSHKSFPAIRFFRSELTHWLFKTISSNYHL